MVMHMFRFCAFYLVLALFFGMALPVHAQQTVEQTLADVQHFSPALRAAKERLAREKEALPEAWTGFQPTVTLDYAIGRQRDDNDARTRYEDVNRGALNMDQPLFEGFDNVTAVRRARLDVAAAEKTYEALRLDIFLEAAAAHIAAAQNRALYDITRKNEAAVKERLAATRARHKSGVLTRTDVFQAESRLAEAQALTRDARRILDVSQAAYRQFVGKMPENCMLPEEISSLPASLEDAKKAALKNNPDLAVSDLLSRAADKEVGEARADMWPHLFLRGRMERDYNDGASLSNHTENDSVTLNLSVPLYQAGRVRTQVRQAAATARESRETHDALRYRIVQETTEHWLGFTAARDVIQRRAHAVDRAYKTLTGYSKEFKAGSRSAVDVLDAERDVFETESALVRARADKALSAYRLLRSIGALEVDVKPYKTAQAFVPVSAEKIPGNGPEEMEKAPPKPPVKPKKMRLPQHTR